MPDRELAIPVSLPKAVLTYSQKYGANMSVVKSSPRAVLEKSPLSFLYDGVAGAILLFCLLAHEGESIRELVDDLPEVHFVKKTVMCPWDAKGRIMRKLASEQGTNASVEGVTAEYDHGRVLVLPHAEEAVYELFAEASTWEVADELSDVFAEKIRSMIEEK